MSFDYEATYDWRRTKRWRSLRLNVLDRDNHICQIRTPKCKGVATTVDHIIPVATAKQNGLTPMETNSLMNLRAACTACNYSLGQRARSKKPSLYQLTSDDELGNHIVDTRVYQRETWFNPIWF